MAEYLYRKSGPRYRVTLSCGCRIRVAMIPYGRKTQFACNSRLGHGYRLGWIRWENLETSEMRENFLR